MAAEPIRSGEVLKRTWADAWPAIKARGFGAAAVIAVLTFGFQWFATGHLDVNSLWPPLGVLVIVLFGMIAWQLLLAPARIVNDREAGKPDATSMYSDPVVLEMYKLYDRGNFLREQLPKSELDPEPTDGLVKEVRAWQTRFNAFFEGPNVDDFWRGRLADPQPSRSLVPAPPPLRREIDHQLRSLSNLYHDRTGAYLEV